jgi:hypothetical protein
VVMIVRSENMVSNLMAGDLWVDKGG